MLFMGTATNARRKSSKVELRKLMSESSFEMIVMTAFRNGDFGAGRWVNGVSADCLQRHGLSGYQLHGDLERLLIVYRHQHADLCVSRQFGL